MVVSLVLCCDHCVTCMYYVQILRDVGFERVESEDRTEQFVQMLTKELKFVETNKHDLVSVRAVYKHGHMDSL